MTLQQHRHDAHHDLTWLLGALARAIFVRARDDAVAMTALQRLAECGLDFADTAPRAAPSTCRWLPEALTAALPVAEEAAMALAAAQDHLRWRALHAAPQDSAAMATVAGPQGPLVCPKARLQMLLTAPQARLPLATDGSALLLVLAGEAAFRDAHGALQHVPAGEFAPLPRHTHLMSAAPTPLLAGTLQA